MSPREVILLQCDRRPHEQLPQADVMPNVKWGRADVLFTPAYWRFQAEAISDRPQSSNHRLTTSLRSECVACLLGGHGIPAEVGLAAFAAIRDEGILQRDTVSHKDVLRVLSKPLPLPNGRSVRYRFVNQKSLYVTELLNSFEVPATTDCVDIRNWLTGFRGIGLKTASWIVRNWYGADDVAILDIHIHRAGLLAGFFDPAFTLVRDYLRLERCFLDFANAIGVRPSMLDALIWQQMKAAGTLVHRIECCYHGSHHSGRCAA